MTAADDFHDLGHGLFGWSAYDPKVRVDLHAHALATGGELVCVDPIPLLPEAWAELLGAAGVSRVGPILLTNGNHARAADAFRRRFGATVGAAEGAQEALREDGLEVDGAPRGLESVALPGFGPGEAAYFHPADGGTIFIGDALINLSTPHGFSVLPDKYCADPRLARASLRRLLDLNFVRMLFAHGTPLLAGARAKLEALLASMAP